MKITGKAAFTVLVCWIVLVPVWAQERGGQSSSAASGGASSSIASRGSSEISSGTSSSVSRDYGSSSASYTPSYSSSSGDYSRGAVSSAPRGGGGYVPNLQYTSFSTPDYYFQWQNFYSYLRMHYFMNSSYFGRFYRNREPLMTPELLKLTMRQPLRLSMQLVSAVDELESMIKDQEAGKTVDRSAISAKTQEIRDLAKKIRQDESLAFFDQRRDKDVLKLSHVDGMGLEAVGKLREMALDLNTQLKNMYSQTQPSTVSVQSLAAPSFESLTKGIDRLSKVIDSSARKI